jgi:two-component system response regulator YesN
LFHFVKSALDADLQSEKDYFQGIIAVLLRTFYENVSADSKLSLGSNIFSQKINHCNDSDELELIIKEIVTQLMEEIITKGTTGRNPEIKAAIAYMSENYYQEITLADVAAAAAISPGYLSKLFKEYCNQTVMDFLERIRIERALKLIKESDYSIKEISLQVGYRDPNYFSKVFKKVTNSSPTAIRN